MASPQIENGYLKIANELVKKFSSYRISGQEWQILWVIFMKTYGFNKKSNHISLSQFAELTGINKPGIIREIKKLLSKKVIIIQKDNDFKITYSFVKDYETWKPFTKKTSLSKMITNVIQNDNKRYPKGQRLLVKDTIKDNIKDKQLTTGVIKAHAMFLERFKGITGTDYIVTSWGKDRKLLKTIIKNTKLEEFNKILDNFFANEYAKKSNYSFGLFTSQINRWRNTSERQSDSQSVGWYEPGGKL